MALSNSLDGSCSQEGWLSLGRINRQVQLRHERLTPRLRGYPGAAGAVCQALLAHRQARHHGRKAAKHVSEPGRRTQEGVGERSARRKTLR
eukprot:CAMPEP_0115050454 /NCGR_PEP_ID=MMETSP0227-20121206/1791_1 /TAXON_ID=89957 /ORGANISM="Polarella glacialis, Strain CCMP 1383" /LENGTH=90 /DNA_ID=CAMNT_0002434307 /DNA_START=561 /DNA_END=833 /DNA_ORIENTATION=-